MRPCSLSLKGILTIKDSIVIGAAIDFQLKDQSMSWKDKYINYYQQITTNTSNGGSKSDDNAVNGTPDRYHLSNPENHSERN
ncbi:hypothetical protein INO76_15420, partial [Staphylococcus aureus]|nr:hypothetical protein [Staphylococcus aureus]